MVLAISPPPSPPARGRGRPLARRRIAVTFATDPIPPRSARSPALLAGNGPPLCRALTRPREACRGTCLRQLRRKEWNNGKDIKEDEDRHRDDGDSDGNVERARERGSGGDPGERHRDFRAAEQAQEVTPQCAEGPAHPGRDRGLRGQHRRQGHPSKSRRGAGA